MICSQDIPAIYKDLHGYLCRYAAKLCHDPVLAEEVVGEVFEKFIEKVSEGKAPQTNLRSYLFQSVYHQVIDAHRLSKRLAPLEVALEIPGDKYLRPTEREVEKRMDVVGRQRVVEIAGLLMKTKLTAEEHLVIRLRFLEGQSLKETSDAILADENYVKVTQHRGVAKLQKALRTRIRMQ